VSQIPRISLAHAPQHAHRRRARPPRRHGFTDYLQDHKVRAGMANG
jgi:hypothetical protein